MSDSARFALHRPELLQQLVSGEQKMIQLMKGSEYSLAADAVLVEAGNEHEFVYRLVRGWIARSRLLPDGRNQFILIFLPGDFFAVKSMFMTRHPDEIRCISNCIVERVEQRALRQIFANDSDVASRCIWQVMEEERRLHSWVVSLGQGSTEERIAVLFIDFLNRLVLARAIPEDAVQFPMPLTQSQLADHLGITAVHVNRTLKVFRDNGILTVRDGVAFIANLDALRTLAMPLLDAHDRATASAPSTGGRAS
jgi:CRP/FNR family transcriptional regulator, anaerobic regulatory protein